MSNVREALRYQPICQSAERAGIQGASDIFGVRHDGRLTVRERRHAAVFLALCLGEQLVGENAEAVESRGLGSQDDGAKRHRTAAVAFRER
jgi:hypothetical protein